MINDPKMLSRMQYMDVSKIKRKPVTTCRTPRQKNINNWFANRFKGQSDHIRNTLVNDFSIKEKVAENVTEITEKRHKQKVFNLYKESQNVK